MKTNRREWLRHGLGAAGAAAGGAVLASAGSVLAPAPLAAQLPTSRNARLGGLLSQLGQQAFWTSPELRLLRRTSHGHTASQVARALDLGYEAYLEEQLNPQRIENAACDSYIAATYRDLLALSPRQAMNIADSGSPYYQIIRPLGRMTVERAMLSERTLLERMVEFWSDHFHVPIDGAYSLKLFHDQQVVRPNALGKVSDLINASMRSSAMLWYLDQVWNTKWGINENYARELMELHTVGWDGGYTQSDVRELARVLTGWSVDGQGIFQYKADLHDFDAKTVFGMNFPARTSGTGTAGMDEGVAFADMLANHPATKRFIAAKLLRWFVRPDPTEAQIGAVVTAYTRSGGDIKAILRVVLSRENLMRAPAKLKRPMHLMVSALRTTGARAVPVADVRRDFDGLYFPLEAMGHRVGGWPTPDGYPDRAEFWAGMIIDRWNNVNTVLQVANTASGWTVVDVDAFMATPTVDGVVAAIRSRLFGGEMSADLDAELRSWLTAGLSRSRVLDALHLATMAPEFQFY
jgi:uncharacterized protein (DUF1800 family)